MEKIIHLSLDRISNSSRDLRYTVNRGIAEEEGGRDRSDQGVSNGKKGTRVGGGGGMRRLYAKRLVKVMKEKEQDSCCELGFKKSQKNGNKR